MLFEASVQFLSTNIFRMNIARLENSLNLIDEVMNAAPYSVHTIKYKEAALFGAAW